MVISVGGKYPLPVPAFSGVQIWLSALILTFGLDGISDVEVEQFKQNPIHFYTQDIEGLLAITVNTALGWGEGFVAAQSDPNAELEAPSDDPNVGYGMHVLLVDVRTQIVKAQRLIGLSRSFSQGLYSIWLRHRNDVRFSDQEFHRKVLGIQARFPHTKLLAQRAQFRYKSGEAEIETAESD